MKILGQLTLIELMFEFVLCKEPVSELSNQTKLVKINK